MDPPAPPGSEDELQRWLLLELVSSPPAEGDDMAYLSHALEESPALVHAAVQALVTVGLAVRTGDQVHASPAARRFDALWPART
jgi:hypothetical protein